MGRDLVLIVLMVGVVTYIVVELWRFVPVKKRVKRRNLSADGRLTQTRRVYATLNQSNGTTDVGFDDGSRRRHTPDLAATYKRVAGQIEPPRRDRLNMFRTMIFSAVGESAVSHLFGIGLLLAVISGISFRRRKIFSDKRPTATTPIRWRRLNVLYGKQSGHPAQVPPCPLF